jgi:transposase InsO family protein
MAAFAPTNHPTRGTATSCRLVVRLLHNAELLNGEIFTTLREAQIVIESWRQHYNRVRPHSSLGYKPPAPEIVAWPASPAVEGAQPAIASRAPLN